VFGPCGFFAQADPRWCWNERSAAGSIGWALPLPSAERVPVVPKASLVGRSFSLEHLVRRGHELR